MIVSLSAWKKSGKDHAAELLIKNLGFKRLAFADVLKDMVAEQYGIDRKSLDDQNLKEKAILSLPVDPKDKFSEMVTNFMSREFAKGEDGRLYWTPRALAILEGSVKRSVNSTYWVSRALSKMQKGDRAVIADMRYRSEAAQIKEFADKSGIKSLVVRINRFDESPSTDPSERDMDNYGSFDHIIENKGTIEEFEDKVLRMVKDIL